MANARALPDPVNGGASASPQTEAGAAPVATPNAVHVTTPPPISRDQLRQRPKPPSDRLRVVMDENFDFVWRQLRRFGLPSDAADDAAQRVFMVASERLDAIEIGRERAFLFGTAMRTAMEARRTVARRREVLDDETYEPRDTGALPDEMIDRERARRVLDEVLESLEMDVRAVFILFEIEEMTMADIASLLELPSGTVASRLRRGRARFEEVLHRQKAKGAFR
jgi:RNA polymerase sigma-70 factor (ECF subfamily)